MSLDKLIVIWPLAEYNINMAKYLIYKITFPNTKVYVGLTSKELEVRKKQHLRSADQPKSHSKLPVHKAISKHKDSITWEIIEDNITSRKKALKKEISYIKALNSSNRKFGYNATKGGGGVRMNQQTKQKLKSSLKTYFINPLSREKVSVAHGGKPFYAISVASGLVLAEHNTQAEAAKVYNVLQAAISSCLRGKIHCVGDIAFRFNPILEPKPRKKSNPNRGLLSTRQMTRWSRQIEVYDLNGNLLHTFNNVKTCAQILNIEAFGISRVLCGQRKKYKNMIFKAQDPAQPIVYLVCGASGSGKSWVCNQLAQHMQYVNYDQTPKKIAREALKKATKPSLYDPPVGISTFIKYNKDDLDIKLLIILGDFITVKDQLVKRGGKVTTGLYRRWKRMNVLKKRAIFSGSSSEVLNYLKQTCKITIKSETK